ncbi:Primosomal protein N' [Weissella viridescens]|uniref:Primosomal protein N n=1 Tax=Weissella viridescens TaxID=1629 RepID=A0A380P7I7_WEIVI|nr:Primosomal protein N' [Weissella viridescens]
MLVPEITLTPQMVRRVKSRFGEAVAVLHSALSDGERYDEWRRIERGEARVVVGARSAIFAPLQDIGLIIWMKNTMPRISRKKSAISCA